MDVLTVICAALGSLQVLHLNSVHSTFQLLSFGSPKEKPGLEDPKQFRLLALLPAPFPFRPPPEQGSWLEDF